MEDPVMRELSGGKPTGRMNPVDAEAEGINARGGKIGTKLNLMKDGAKHTGKALGKFLLQNMKKTGRNR